MRFHIFLLLVVGVEAASSKECRTWKEFLSEKPTCDFSGNVSTTGYVIDLLGQLDLGIALIRSTEYEQVICAMKENDCIRKNKKSVEEFKVKTSMYHYREDEARRAVAERIVSKAESTPLKKKTPLRLGCIVATDLKGKPLICLMEWPLKNGRRRTGAGKRKGSSETRSREESVPPASERKSSPAASPAEATPRKDQEADLTNLQNPSSGEVRSEQASSLSVENSPQPGPDETQAHRDGEEEGTAV